MTSIQNLISDFQENHAFEFTNEQRVVLIKEMVTQHGYDLVMEATGYKMSSLNQIVSGKNPQISDERVRQAIFVFTNLKPE